jgi:putative ABC transport system permease protein
MLRRTPGFTAVAALTLALGIGATTAIFSIVNAVLLRPLPYPDSDRLVRLYENIPAAESPNGKPRRIGAVDTRDLLELRVHSRTLSHVITYSFATVTISGCGDAIRLRGAPVSTATFPMLGIQPMLGRWFTQDEELAGHDHVVVLGYNAWQRCFGRDPDVLGRVLTFTGRAAGPLGGNVALGQYTVVGVMPAGFHFPDDEAQFLIPRSLTPAPDGRSRRLGAMARLADSVAIEAAAADVDAVLRSFHGQAPSAPSQRPAAQPRFELARVQDEVGAPVKPALQVLIVAVGFVFLIACANVANLLLARTASRQREIAVRIALGAGRSRVIRQALTESMLLSLLGGVAGTALAFGGLYLFRTLGTSLARADLGASATFPRLNAMAVDGRVLEFALLVSIAAGMLFGLAPATRTGWVDQMDALRDGPMAKPSSFTLSRRLTAQGILVIAEIGMATVLFIGGGLMMRSFIKLVHVNPGYSSANVLTLDEIVSNSTIRPRMYAVLLSVFASVAVGLAAIGIYGVMAYSVSRRTREIGIRIALGARHAEVLGLVLRQSGMLTIIGMVTGLVGAVGMSRYLAGLLFATTPLDSVTLGSVLIAFASIATLAAYVPARRATRVDPSVALRCE